MHDAKRRQHRGAIGMATDGVASSGKPAYRPAPSSAPRLDAVGPASPPGWPAPRGAARVGPATPNVITAIRSRTSHSGG
jgi:hypothetical protein